MNPTEGMWVHLVTLKLQNEKIVVPITVASNMALITVTLGGSPNLELQEAGRIEQYATVEDKRVLLLKKEINLNGQVIEIYPSVSELEFIPVDWISNWNFLAMARLYVPADNDPTDYETTRFYL